MGFDPVSYLMGKTSGGGGRNMEQQLAYVETGTTASRNYSAGEYICWNGLTYTADTNIALGAALSASGSNKNLTECVGGGLNSVRVSYVEYVTQSDLTLEAMSNGFYDVTDTIPAGYTAIFATITNPSVAAHAYVILWVNDWMGEKRLNVFHFRNVQQTIPADTIIRMYIVKN